MPVVCIMSGSGNSVMTIFILKRKDEILVSQSSTEADWKLGNKARISHKLNVNE